HKTYTSINLQFRQAKFVARRHPHITFPALRTDVVSLRDRNGPTASRTPALPGHRFQIEVRALSDAAVAHCIETKTQSLGFDMAQCTELHAYLFHAYKPL